MSICVTLSSIRFPTLTAHASSPFKILRIYANNSAFRMNWYITVIPRESEIAVGPQLTPLEDWVTMVSSHCALSGTPRESQWNFPHLKPGALVFFLLNMLPGCSS